MTPCCEGLTRCEACGETWCREEVVSPGEGDGLCAECFETEDAT